MSIASITGPIQILVPGTPLSLWESGELHDYLHLPHDGTRVEVIDGMIAVTHAPMYMHNAIADDIAKAFIIAEALVDGFLWRVAHNNGLLLTEVEGGYIPDLVVIDAAVDAAIRRANARRPAADEIDMVVEVTSPSNADQDRALVPGKAGVTKWCGYARAAIPYYLLVDRDPKVAQIILYSIPDPTTGGYLHQECWAFGETLRLPEPFNVEIPTATWLPWD